MRLSLSTRLAMSFLGVILVGMALIAPATWLSVEAISVKAQTENLKAQAEMIAAAIDGSTATLSAPGVYFQMSNVQPGIHTRIINAQGGAVIDLTATGGEPDSSEVNLPGLAQNPGGVVSPAELLARPEIAAAQKGVTASAVRRVAQVGGQPVLYVAAPVVSPQGLVVQLVYLAAPIADTRWGPCH